MAYLGVPQSKLENLTTNVQIVNLGASFDGTTVTFNLQDSRGDAVFAVHERALLVVLGGITQKPGVDYTTSGSTITFTTAPVSNLTIHIRKMYGVQRIIGVNDGVISPIKLSTGGPSWNSSGNVTISGDLNVTGSFNAGTNGLFWEDNERAKFGADNDLEIYHTGSDSFIRDSGTGNLYIEGTDLTLRASSASEMRYLEANESNGDVSLFFGNNKKFETTAQGISVTGDINGSGNFKLTSTNVGSTAAPEIDLFRNSSSPADADYIGQIKFTGKQDGGGTVNYAKITGKILDASNGTEDGIIEFMIRKAGSNNIAARFRSDSLQLLNGTGLTVAGNISLDDNSKIRVGTGNDLEIYHDTSNSIIKDNGVGKLILDTDGTAIEFQKAGLEYLAKFNTDGAVELYYDNSKKFETTTTGAKVTGALEVTQEYPTIRPTLDLNFAATKTLDRRITFTRDSIGTYTDDMGIIRYASNNVPRFDHDFDTRESLGLLIEESRTNLFPYGITPGDNWSGAIAGSSFTQNTTEVTAPDGTNTATKWKFTSGDPYLYHQHTLLANTTYTMSIWVKAGTNMSGDAVQFRIGAGPYSTNAESTLPTDGSWKRLTFTKTIGGSNETNANVGFEPQTLPGLGSPAIGDVVYIWGAQLEIGSFATSFIPTNGSTVTRAADIAKITGTNFTDFYNQTEGTVFSSHQQYSGQGDTQNTYVYQIANATSSSVAFRLLDKNNYYSNPARLTATQWSNDVALQKPDATNGERIKTAFACKVNDAAVSYDGATVLTDTSLDMNSGQIEMSIGAFTQTPQAFLNGHIQQISYYNKRLPNAQLQGLTQQ